MTKSFTLAAIAIAGLLLTPRLPAAPQEGGALERELIAHFVPTKLEKNKVVKAGTVVSVQKDGIGAISPNTGMSMSRLAGSDAATFPNNYKSGSVKHDLKGAFLTNAGAIRDLDVNEKVYITKIEVKDAGIVVVVQSCGTCDPKLPDPEHTPARASVNFSLGKPYLASATPAQVVEVIGHVFAPVDAGATAPQTFSPAGPAPAASEPMAPMAPIPPPPPPVDAPAAPPAEVKMGQTPDQVVAAMGKPQQIFNLGPKMIYKYQRLKITFVNGKVTDVE